MKYEEFKQNLKDLKIKKDAEVVIHTESGDYHISQLQYNKLKNVFSIATMDETKTVPYRCTYRITKDHSVYEVVTKRITLGSNEDPILDMDDLIERFKKDHGFDKYEVSEKTGSIIVPSKEMVPVLQSDGSTVKMEEKKVDHYFNLEMMEIFKVIDDENDIFIRVWKDGDIG